MWKEKNILLHYNIIAFISPVYLSKIDWKDKISICVHHNIIKMFYIFVSDEYIWWQMEKANHKKAKVLFLMVKLSVHKPLPQLSLWIWMLPSYLKKHVFHHHGVIKQLEANSAMIPSQHISMFIDDTVIPLNNLST